MGLIEEAIKFEHEGYKFFMDHANRIDNPAVKGILESLAADELVHAEFLEEMKNGTAKTFPASESMKKIKVILTKAVDENPNFMKEDPSIREILEAAMAVEVNAKNHYTEESIAAQTPENKELLRKLAKEEDRHYNLLKNLLDFYESPKNILESQEFQYYED